MIVGEGQVEDCLDLSHFHGLYPGLTWGKARPPARRAGGLGIRQFSVAKVPGRSRGAIRNVGGMTSSLV